MTKTIVITGASSGIGANAAGRLAAAGWDVAVVGRNPERTKAVAEQVGGTAFLADYDRLDDVRELAASVAKRYDRIDVLANNAGGLIHKRGLSTDGHERTLQHNHLAPFLLTDLLMPVLEASSARVIGTASVANLSGNLRLDDLEWTKRPWLGGWRAYGTSKIATIVFARSLAERGIDAYSFHPGYVATNFGVDSPLVRFGNFVSRNRLAISPEQGASPLVHLATADELGVPSGTYFDRLDPYGRVNSSANSPGVGEALWAASSTYVSLT
ncbi:MAG: SDR family NAD(P)-dependent oxidoreductase [Salinibacterium sp.]|nr:SDR family NAD(P)-dependent oxidoreductase [Salinibacterium sp.]